MNVDDDSSTSSTEEYVNSFLYESHRRKLQDLLAIIAGIIDDYDTTQSKEYLDQNYHKPIHELIQSNFRTDAGFLDATCFDIYKRSMEDAMKTLIDEIETTFKVGEAEKSLFLTELWAAAFLVGDGSLSAQKKRKEGRWENPRQDFAIKDNYGGNIIVKKFLLHRNQDSLGWRLVRSKENPEMSSGVVRTINRRLFEETDFLFTTPLMSSYKKMNLMVIAGLSQCTRLSVDGHRPCNEESEMAFNAQVVSIEWLNMLHGTTLSRRWYEEDFQRIANDANMPFLFDLVLAGMIGSDGSVGLKKWRVFKIYQAHSVYCEVLANVMSPRYGVSPRVRTRMSSTLRSKPITTIHFNVADTEKLMLRVGSFDLNRPDQHIVLMLKALLINGNRNSPIQNVGRMIVLLNNLTSYIKKERPS